MALVLFLLDGYTATAAYPNNLYSTLSSYWFTRIRSQMNLLTAYVQNYFSNPNFTDGGGEHPGHPNVITDTERFRFVPAQKLHNKECRHPAEQPNHASDESSDWGIEPGT